MLRRGRQLVGRTRRLIWSRRRQVPEMCSIDPSPESYQSLAKEIDRVLRESLLGVWYPHCIDRICGGYHQRHPLRWSGNDENNKSLVCQARLAWTAAVAAGYATECRDQYIYYALHGLDFLDRVMRDGKFGGFYWRLDRAGQLNDRFGDDKHVYGIAFVIYAGAEIYRQTMNNRGLQVALDAYHWLETQAADHENGGYFERLRRDGSYISPPSKSSRDKHLFMLNTLVGYKSMNTHIHLLEAYTLLYQIWPDAELRKRLEHILHIVRDRIAVAPGALNLYFTPDWRAVPAHDSFGHDVEAAYLLTESSNVLGRPKEAATWDVAKQLVDHALVWGWDDTYGGFYDKGESFYRAHDTRKLGWVQAEGLNTLLLMHERFRNETNIYFEAFAKQWWFIRKFQIDHSNGGWYTVLDRNGQTPSDPQKVDDTGSIYHYVRALVNGFRKLHHLATTAPQAEIQSPLNQVSVR